MNKKKYCVALSMIACGWIAFVDDLGAEPSPDRSPSTSASSVESTPSNDGTSWRDAGVSGAGQLFVLSDGSVVAKWEAGFSRTDPSSPPAHLFILPGDEGFTLIKNASEWRLVRTNGIRMGDSVPSSALRIRLGIDTRDTPHSVLEMKGMLAVSAPDMSGLRTLRLEESGGREVFSMKLTLDETDAATRAPGGELCCSATCAGIVQTSCSCSMGPCSCFCGLFGARCECGGVAGQGG